ncbi:MAG: hypothetical protein HW388_777 [Dehalococcoidia bacterium]|nr:hypothetical protein [Dehalococcoidia bacterium]
MGMREQNTITELLQSEHRWVDERFQGFRQHLAEGRVDAEPFQEAAKVLYRHIYLEEVILFPEVEARGVVGPTAVMAQEHGEIWRLLEGIQDRIRQNAGAGRIQDAFDALHSLLEEHNFKEEKILYPSADRLLDSARVVAQLKQATLPDGWVCLALQSGRS